VDEVNTYGKNHVNRYTTSSVGTAYNQNGYGGMTYYSSETCRYHNGSFVTAGCTTDYAQSEIKYAVDAWEADKFKSSDLKEDETGYSARLLTPDELINNLGYTREDGATYMNYNSEKTSDWVYNSNYYYWTMIPYEDSALYGWYVGNDGTVGTYDVYNSFKGVVRPVVTLLKSAIK